MRTDCNGCSQRRAAVALAEKQSKNRNVFLDERFGEDDEEIGYEEKMLRRFQKERAVFHTQMPKHERMRRWDCRREPASSILGRRATMICS